MFITIVTNPRRRIFGDIVDAKLRKTRQGLAVERRIAELGQMIGIKLFNFVVMPDHVHLQLHLRAGLQKPLVVLGRAIGAFKSLCAKDYHELTGERGSLWQQGYHDWICQSAEMIDAVNRYIDYNPLKFELRYNQPGYLAIHEPLDGWRLPPDEFWRGIGAVELLDGDLPFIALRITRRLTRPQIAEVVARIRRKVGDYVFIGGWISPGEKAVRDMLLAEPKGRIIQVLPSAMPHDYKVGSMWLEAIRSRRAAIIARGNSEVEFSRAACLAVNEVAAGLAAQALPSGQLRADGAAGEGCLATQALPSGQLRADGAAGEGGLATQALPSGQLRADGAAGEGCLATQALPSGHASHLGREGKRGVGSEGERVEGRRGMAVYWLPEGPKVVS